MKASPLWLVGLVCAPGLIATSCPEYRVSNVTVLRNGLQANLSLDGPPCTTSDVSSLKLMVTYDEVTRLHIQILDASSRRYEVPSDTLARPVTKTVDSTTAALTFSYEHAPFSFNVTRRATGEVLFSTQHASPLIYRKRHLSLQTHLPKKAAIYGLGESTDPFRIPPGTLRTLWARDAYGTPEHTNLYSSHPIYFDHRPSGTHAVFLLNSNGMDVSVEENSLKYDIMGGVLDLYFLSGPSPVEVAQQYSDIVGKPAMIPFWALGFQQCRYGYNDYTEVAEVIANYSKAGIPLETMWTDIDYMYKRRVFTLDEDYFPLRRMREIVGYLHKHDQRYVMMVDPAVAYQPGDQGAFDRGAKADVFLKESDGSYYKGVVWAGVSVYPDWFHPSVQGYWSGEIERFFDPDHGIDIDGIWIDMNEPANFAIPCKYPCTNSSLTAEAQAMAQHNPPTRLTPPPPKDIIGTDSSLPTRSHVQRRQLESQVEKDGAYQIHNAAGDLDHATARTDLVHHNGLIEYDTHNLFGARMSLITRRAMLKRKPSVRPQIITRSTFPGSGTYAGHWTGDNRSDWPHYRSSIAQMLSFASIFQIPFVGSDVCGFAGNTTEQLCARWATLGAFYPFYRNHNELGATSQEFYRWPSVAHAAHTAIMVRYSLLDYLYTHLQRQQLEGIPAIQPLWFAYPRDTRVVDIESQFFFGDCLLVSPVMDENSTSVQAYFPETGYHDFHSRKSVNQKGIVTFSDVSIDQVPLHIKPGSIIPIRDVSAPVPMTTTAVRKRPFEILVVPDIHGTAHGQLFLDDGETVLPEGHIPIAPLIFEYNDHQLRLSGPKTFGSVIVKTFTFLGIADVRQARVIGGESGRVEIDSERKSVRIVGNWTLGLGNMISVKLLI